MTMRGIRRFTQALDDGITTIEDVRKTYNRLYEGSNLITKLMLKCWLNYSESRARNNNQPLTFNNYTNHMRVFDYAEQVKLNMIDCEDIGGKEYILSFLDKRGQ